MSARVLETCWRYPSVTWTSVRTALSQVPYPPIPLYLIPYPHIPLSLHPSIPLSFYSVSGPPCPPFSSIGKRLIEMDARASVFVTVAMWILHLVHHGNLTWWVLENVSGIRKRRRGETKSFAEWFLDEMGPELPTGWRIDVVEHNSCECLLPQSRPRVFFIGTSGALRQTPLQRRLLSTAPLSRPRVDIIHFLDPSPSTEDWYALTLRQQVNLLEQLHSFQSSCAPDATVAIVDVARDPLGQVDATAVVGGTRTLRTNCAYLWVLPSAAWVPTFGSRGRFLSRAEKCRIAGLVPSSMAGLSDNDVERAVGNTIPPPLIGVVMYPVLRAWAEHIRNSASGC